VRPVPQRTGDRHKVKTRTFRATDELWLAFKRKAADEGKSATEVLVRLIRRYLDE
jgi:hypothetical protein